MKLMGFVAGGVFGFLLGILGMYATRSFRAPGGHGNALIEAFFGGVVVSILGAFFGLLFAAGRRP
jgi:hypothetical protein